MTNLGKVFHFHFKRYGPKGHKVGRKIRCRTLCSGRSAAVAGRGRGEQSAGRRPADRAHLATTGGFYNNRHVSLFYNMSMVHAAPSRFM